MQTATATKTEIEVATEKLAAAKAKLHGAEAALNGARNAHAEALRGYFAAAGTLTDLKSLRMMGGQKV